MSFQDFVVEVQGIVAAQAPSRPVEGELGAVLDVLDAVAGGFPVSGADVRAAAETVKRYLAAEVDRAEAHARRNREYRQRRASRGQDQGGGKTRRRYRIRAEDRNGDMVWVKCTRQSWLKHDGLKDPAR